MLTKDLSITFLRREVSQPVLPLFFAGRQLL